MTVAADDKYTGTISAAVYEPQPEAKPERELHLRRTSFGARAAGN